MKRISKVRVEHRDEPRGGRIVRIATSVGTVETPTRAPTSTELNAKVNIHFEEPWDNLVFEVASRFLDVAQVQALHQKNGAYATKRRALAAQVDKFRGYALTKYFPQLALGTTLDARDVRTLLDLQVEAGFDVISIPEPSSSCTLKRFEENLDRSWSYISAQDRDLAVMPYASMSQDPAAFKAKLTALVEHEGDLRAIGLHFASPLTFRPNYLTLSEFGDRDVWFHSSGGRRYPSPRQPLAQLHAIQRFGVDSVSLGVPQAPVRGDPDWRYVRYFDRGTVTYPRIQEACGREASLPCGCPLCRHRKLDDLVSHMRSLGNQDELVLRINDAARVHEVYASTAEFEDARRAIREGRLVRYFRRKAGLKPFLMPEDNQARLVLE